MENFKKIQEVYNKLSEMREFKNIYELSNVADFRAKECMNLIREFLVDNDKSRKVKKNDLSVWDFVANDTVRPVMNYVHYNHEDKVAVASDGLKLFVSHKDYRPIHETYEVEITKDGKKTKEVREYTIYDKYDKGIEGRYPNYKGVIPHDKSLTPVTLASEEDITKRIAEAKAYHKSQGLGKPNKRIVISVMGEDHYGVDFTFRNLAVSLEHVNFMLSAGLDGWQIKFDNKYSNDYKNVGMFVKKFDNGDVILLMPIYFTIDDNEDASLEQVNNIKFKNFDKDIC